MKQTTHYRIIVAGLVLTLMSALAACQKVDQPKTTLTQKQWQEVKTHILDEAPEPEFPIGANFDDKIELIGFDVSKPLSAGKPATFTWYWKALDNIDDNWKVFIHFDSSKKPFRQNLDHHPLDGLYQTSRWKKGQIIEDVQKVTLKGDYPGGQAVPYVGFYKGQSRLPIKNEVQKTEDRRVIGPQLTVKGSAKTAKADKLPSHIVPKYDAKRVADHKIDGKLDEEVYSKLKHIELDGFGSAPKLDTKVYAFRGDDHLYIGAKLADEHVWSKLDKRDADTWTEEVFEVYIDNGRDGKDYLELQINPLGTIFDAHFVERLGRGEGSRDEQIDRARKWNMEGLESAVHVEGTVNDDSDTDKFWSVELKIPFEAIPGIDAAPESNDKWAVNFYRYDRPDDKRTLAYAWSKPNGGSFHQVERFGTLRFVDSKKAIKRLDPKQVQQLRKNLNIQKVKPRQLRRAQDKSAQ